MNIQPSVIIWTIICFFVLMFVLDRLLFRPMFAFMRVRRELRVPLPNVPSSNSSWPTRQKRKTKMPLPKNALPSSNPRRHLPKH